MLRADMDALPIEEESGFDFASKNPGICHACGHDMHTTSLIMAAKMLKENEDKLAGTVKFMFQHAEELAIGSKDMIEAGILENPKVDVALGFHIAVGKYPINLVAYNSNGAMMYSADNFRITIKGKGSHGAYPHMGIDPIYRGVNIYQSLQELIAREVSPSHANVLTIGKFSAGDALNIIPDTAVMEGAIRFNTNESRDVPVRRLHEIVEKMGDIFNGQTSLEIIGAVPPVINDRKLAEEMEKYLKELNPEVKLIDGMSTSSSDDFAYVGERVPSVFMHLSGGFEDERGDYPIYHPKVHFNEDFLIYAPAYFSGLASKWLENNKY